MTDARRHTPAVLTTETAEITTAAVEIKTLTIRGKQVTLAVFRQLEEKPLFAETGDLNGIPWGRVNYHPDKCADSPGHMHLVWQEGDELRRARVATAPRFGAVDYESAADYVSLRWAQSLIGPVGEFWEGKLSEWQRQRGRAHPRAVDFTLTEAPRVYVALYVHDDVASLPPLPPMREYAAAADRLTALLATDPQGHEAVRQQTIRAQNPAYSHLTPPQSLDELIAAARDRCDSAVARAHEAARAVHEYVTSQPPAEQLRAALAADVLAEADRRKRITAATAALAALPQLFIAV